MKVFLWLTVLMLILLAAFSTRSAAEDSVQQTINRAARKLILFVYCAILVLLLTVVVIPNFIAQKKLNRQILETYQAAAETAVQEQYSEAAALLDAVKVSSGTVAVTSSDYRCLKDFCYGMIAYQKGDWEETLDRMPEYELRFLSDSTKEILCARREDALTECRRIQKEERERQYQEDLEKAQNSYAYVGMSEGFINKTKLGPYYSKEEKQPWKGPKVTYYHFYFLEEYYTVTCQGGQVTKVSYYSPSRYSSSKKSSSKKDPYNAKGYDDPEDFYEDYFDEFDGFEDAESYYDKYHG